MVKRNGRKDQTISTPSSFFTILSRETAKNNQFLQEIPPQFVRNDMKNQVPDQMVLECASRGSWPVEVIQTKNGVFLRNDWQTFVEENSLQQRELVFLYTYHGNARLVVQIFDESGLEITPSTANEEVVTKEEQVRIFKANSEHYMFEKTMKHYNVKGPFTLFIPQDFGKEHLPARNKTEVTLINGDDKSWKVNCRRNGVTFYFVGGWMAFVKGNSLKIGDICVFELVAKLTLRVHVF